jgi:hypothetical protein
MIMQIRPPPTQTTRLKMQMMMMTGEPYFSEKDILYMCCLLFSHLIGLGVYLLWIQICYSKPWSHPDITHTALSQRIFFHICHKNSHHIREY